MGSTTTILYKANGQKDYETSNVGDKVYFDYFGRETKRVHKDSSDINYSYSNSNVTIIDEDNKSTTLYYNAFGDPDGKFLVQVNDAKNNTAYYDYNMLGSIKSVNYGGANRSFNYNEKNVLVTVSHPERGTLNYGRDYVRTITAQSDSVGSVSYAYDGVKRLKDIWRTVTVSISYVGKNLS